MPCESIGRGREKLKRTFGRDAAGNPALPTGLTAALTVPYFLDR
jgi:hypothetical protein